MSESSIAARQATAAALSDWLLRYVDKYDWGYNNLRTNRPVRALTLSQMESLLRGRLRRRHPQELGAGLVASHLYGADHLHFVPRWQSRRWLGLIDVDAHQGQTDAADAAAFVVAGLFPGAYAEPSPRGWHVYTLVEVGVFSSDRFNDLLARLGGDLRLILSEHNFASTVEVKGTFTLTRPDRSVISMGTMAALPKLWNGRPDLDRLTSAPTFPPGVLGTIHRKAELLFEGSAVCAQTRGAANGHLDSPRTVQGRRTADRVSAPYAIPHPAQRRDGGLRSKTADNVGRTADSGTAAAGVPRPPLTHSTQSITHKHQAHLCAHWSSPYAPPDGDAWRRMVSACWSFTCVFRRMPSVDDLLGHYREVHPGADADHPERRRRAEYAIHYRAMTFDPGRAGDHGYEHYRDRLLAAVCQHCTDRTCRYAGVVDDEDLAVALFTVMRASFAYDETPARQWTCPNVRFTAMFTALRDAGLTARRAADRHKIVALKLILTRARLIECLDSFYVPAGKRYGIGKKYTIGPAHWRYAEFVRFAEGIDVRYVRRPEAEKAGVGRRPEASGGFRGNPEKSRGIQACAGANAGPPTPAEVTPRGRVKGTVKGRVKGRVKPTLKGVKGVS